MSERQAPDIGSQREKIAAEMAQVHLESYGVPVTTAEVMMEGDYVTVMLDGDLTRGEQTLVDAGSADIVTGGREAFQQAIGATYAAIVERATGRRVERFASRTLIQGEGAWAVEAFRLSSR